MDLPDIEPTLGLIVESDRGSLPFSLIHGESLVACAAWALGDAGVDLVDLGVSWEAIVDAGEPVVLHDPLCPMTPAGFIVECVRRSVETGSVVVGVREVTDTVKSVEGEPGGPCAGGFIRGTVDRAGLWQVTSPLVLPPAAVAALLPGPPTTKLSALAARLAESFEVVPIPAPAEGRRVGSPDDVRLLQALTTR